MAFVFYDTETTGTNTTYDQILQFAAILTDNDFCELDRFEIRCRLMPHVVPAPGALRATKVSHTVLIDSSLPSHYEAICAIAEKLEPWSPAVFIGYNSLSFDETLLRKAFFQNLKPIYLTNTNRNTRADVLRLVQAASVYAPDSIIVPTTDSGKPTRRLDAIAPANGFDKHNAHDALGDVEATIFMARLIKQRAPEIWAALMPLAAKSTVIERALSNEVLSLTDFYRGVPHSWLVIGCGQNPDYDAQLGVFDLRYDPTDYIDMSEEELVETMNGRAKAIRCIKANAQPILLPKTLARPDLHNLGIDQDEIAKRARMISDADDFHYRVGEAISNRYSQEDSSIYVEETIYGGFPTRADELRMQRFHQIPWEQRAEIIDLIEDKRFHELGYRLIYSEKPEALAPAKRAELDAWCAQRLRPNIEVPWTTVSGALEETEKLLIDDPENTELFYKLGEWLRALKLAPTQ